MSQLNCTDPSWVLASTGIGSGVSPEADGLTGMVVDGEILVGGAGKDRWDESLAEAGCARGLFLWVVVGTA